MSIPETKLKCSGPTYWFVVEKANSLKQMADQAIADYKKERGLS